MRNKNINFDEIELQARRLASMGGVFATVAVLGRVSPPSLALALDLFEQLLSEHADDVNTLMMQHVAERRRNQGEGKADHDDDPAE